MRSSLLLWGTSEIALDDKGRLAVPARYREVLKDECCGECVITRSLFDPCLWLYPKTEWEVAAAALSALPSLTDELCRSLQRLLLGSAVYVKMDGQSRILLPQELRSAGSISKKAVLIGMQNKFELWSEEILQQQRSRDIQMIADERATLLSHPELKNLKL